MDNYRQTIREIYGLQEFAIKLGLENIAYLCEKSGNPQKSYPTIHIAGTNGKGSTAFFIASFLQAHGLKVGLYTSPHLCDYRERIRINNQLIEAAFITDFWEKHKELIYERKATFFDTTTALGFSYFARNNVDVAVIETGLGGRLDSTNIIQPEIAVLTPVHFDHQKQLGNTLDFIAREKAGIIKPGAQIYCAPQPAEVLEVFLRHINQTTAFFYQPEITEIQLHEQTLDRMRFSVRFKTQPKEVRKFTSKQVGHFQVRNIVLAMLVARAFLEKKNIRFRFSAAQKILQE